MKKILTLFFAAAILSISGMEKPNQTGDDAKNDAQALFTGMEFRNIGPGFMSGRIADIAVSPVDDSVWYVGVGSGGVWKTENAGTTWKPVFDKQTSYSIGAITLDPANPNVVWVGTGENVGGRHVGYGDGIYLSRDGGKNWENKGLADSEHISKIIVHPQDSDTIWVAVQGPLWSKGKERGLYKSTDGGASWERTLAKGEWTGVTDLVIDPRNPDRLYVATWQHHRSVAAYMGGGPESGIHVSSDGGETWRELKHGLPEGNKGKIGLAVSPINPDVLYANIELNRRKGGMWRSADRGESWKKMSDAIGGGTGPHYYVEVYASPHQFDKIYMVSNYSLVSEDGGKSWKRVNVRNKHVDDHAIVFRPDDPDYILFGSDGGLYESHDGEKTWRFINNLPILQYYRVAVDDSEPFYMVYGGTQDNNSHGGPSRTTSSHGILNSDWFVTLFADGHQSATEPGNPDIVYAEWQEGNLVRVDRTTGEIMHIQPEAAPGEPLERFNWDAPILVSAHQPTRIYIGSYRLWRSDDRGDSWEALSGDLTKNEDRMMLPLMERQWSWDSGWDFLAMSQYNTITAIAESPVDENRLYVGTDDGLIQTSSDGGSNWRRIATESLPGAPVGAYVNNIVADLFDANKVYVALGNHKKGDFNPYLYKSDDGGASWSSMNGDIPERHLTWRIVQDHVDSELFFLATEFGLFFTADAGQKWVKLQGGVPTISFRDITIQRRENDVVAASFGRGFFILDDYTPLRDADEQKLSQNESMLFAGRDAWWYMEENPLGFFSKKGAQGDSLYSAPNPPFGAVFTYYLRDDIETERKKRQKKQEEAVKAGQNTPFVGYEAVEKERREIDPVMLLSVRDSAGNIVRRLEGPAKKGFHRVAWDMRFPSLEPVTKQSSGEEDEEGADSGFLVAPGVYSVSLAKRVRGVTTELVAPVNFTLKRLRPGALQGAEEADVVAFWQELAGFQRSVLAAVRMGADLKAQAGLLADALRRTRAGAGDPLEERLASIRSEILEIEAGLSGNQSMLEVGETPPANVTSRLNKLFAGTALSTYGPTATHQQILAYARSEYTDLRERLDRLHSTVMPQFARDLVDAGGPWVQGMPLPEPQ